MLSRLEEVEKRFEQIEQALADPQVASDPKELQRLGKAHAELEPIVQAFREYKTTLRRIEEAEALLDDPEMHDLAQEELNTLKELREQQEHQLRLMLLPKDPNDERNVLLEIRAGTGGEEAALFAAELARMYMRYAERRGWKYEVLDVQETGIGGYKEIVMLIEGKGAYSALKYESGVHRVQRVPVTESSGRIHTSAATVAVLPEAEEVEVEINPEDLEIDTFRAGSAGGQHMQKNETAVRILHKPTGIVVTCQDERSQLQNREKAMRMLRTRLYDLQRQQMEAERTATRKSQVGTGDRSEKIRTYNYPQGRVTDHRIGLTIYNLQEILDGDIQPFVDALIAEDQARKLQQAVADEELVRAG